MIQVINAQEYFKPPKTLLVDFLIMKKRKTNLNNDTSAMCITNSINNLVL